MFHIIIGRKVRVLHVCYSPSFEYVGAPESFRYIKSYWYTALRHKSHFQPWKMRAVVTVLAVFEQAFTSCE